MLVAMANVELLVKWALKENQDHLECWDFLERKVTEENSGNQEKRVTKEVKAFKEMTDPLVYMG